MRRDLTLLLRVDDAVTTRARSGIHRVIVELARNLPNHATTHFVRWDDVEGHLRPIDRTEFNLLFGVGAWPSRVRPNPAARRTAYRFDQVIDCSGNTWLINPDVPMHSPDALERLSRAATQCREYGARIASIFYDLIPATVPAYSAFRSGYLAYLAEIIRSDLLLPISHYSAKALMAYLEALVPGAVSIPMEPIPLAEWNRAQQPQAQSGPHEGVILMVGAVEPRKRQLDVLRAYAVASRKSSSLARMHVHIVGSLHGAVADEFHALVCNTPNVHYLDYLPDAEIDRLMARAAFTVFASDNEGFGLPITESLAAGVPCLCANFGAMSEVATGGGCLMIDVRKPEALQAALVELAENPKQLQDLRQEISTRRLRSWDDYAQSVVQTLAAAPAIEAPEIQVVNICRGNQVVPADIDAAVDADVLLCPNLSLVDAVVETAERASAPMLPSRWFVGSNIEAAIHAARRLSTYRSRLLQVAEAEKRHLAMRRAFEGHCARGGVFLRIIITTYNRRAFVVENVRWLNKVLGRHQDIELVVVDNSSTDGTADALRAEFGKKLKIIVNPYNVGMLGNIRVCSQLLGAEYVWVIGDDDFIVAEQLEATIAALHANIGTPLAIINFAIYYRRSLGPSDHAESLISEQIPLAPSAADSGMVPLTVAASQHDNLFTAIYGTIWRHDILAAAYDYPFNGKPFENLVESIPCTKVILESFATCDVLWLKPVGIVGNAHNSWTLHRPRWHGRLMADALSLARDAGIDRRLLAEWAQTQSSLYEAAVKIAREQGSDLNMNEDDFAHSWPLFRRDLAQITL